LPEACDIDDELGMARQLCQETDIEDDGGIRHTERQAFAMANLKIRGGSRVIGRIIG